MPGFGYSKRTSRVCRSRDAQALAIQRDCLGVGIRASDILFFHYLKGRPLPDHTDRQVHALARVFCIAVLEWLAS